jgi:hypothetical protein
VKPRVETIVLEFWIAHEMIVLKKVQGWTWGRFCKEAGYHQSTPYGWFEKYRLKITKMTHKKELKNLSLDNPLKKQTNPDTKLQLSKVAEEIKAKKPHKLPN